MAFIKTGNIFVIKEKQYVTVPQWDNFVKKASKNVIDKKSYTNERKAFNKVIANADLDKWVYIHTTIMASVDTINKDSHLLKKSSEKYINDNGDCWSREALLNDYQTFRTAAVYLEHQQDPEKAKGKVFDVIARDLGDTILIDTLFGVEKRHKDLVANIMSGVANAVSMGCTTGYTKCTGCGHIAYDDKEYCEHIAPVGTPTFDGKIGKGLKGRFMTADNGGLIKVAELCYDNNFFDNSIVASPAFQGALFKRLVGKEDVAKKLLANLLTSKATQFLEDESSGDLILKAASLVSEINNEKDNLINGPIKNPQQIQKIQNIQKLTSSNGNFTIKISKDGEITITKNAISHPIENEKTNEQEKDYPKNSTEIEKIELNPVHDIKDEFDKQQKTDKLAAKDKESVHPIDNTETEKNEPKYLVDREDFTPGEDLANILDMPQLNTLEEFNKQQPADSMIVISNLNKISSKIINGLIKCGTCGHTDEEWKLKASTVDSGWGLNKIICPTCISMIKKISNYTKYKDTYNSIGFKNDIEIPKNKIASIKMKLKKMNIDDAFKKLSNIQKQYTTLTFRQAKSVLWNDLSKVIGKDLAAKAVDKLI